MANERPGLRSFIGGSPLFTGLLDTAMWLCLAGSVAGLFDFQGWPWELPAHFRLQAAAALAVAGLIWLLLRRWMRAAVSVAAAVALWMLSGSPMNGGMAAPARGETLARLCSANVLTQNRQHGGLLDFLRTNAFDAVFLMEVDSVWARAIESLRDVYPHISAEPRGDNFGVAFLSRRAPLKIEILHAGSTGVPSVHADFGAFELMGLHAMPPASQDYTARRDDELAALAKRAKDRPRLVVLGDFNATPWSAPFRRFVAATSLNDSLPPRAWQPTWPAMVPKAFRIPIDHVLLGGDLACANRFIGPDIGSDHLPVVIEIMRR